VKKLSATLLWLCLCATAQASQLNGGNVIAYGADPTGSTPSGAAFASAFASLPARGGRIRIPCGTYDVDQSIHTSAQSFEVIADGAGVVHNASTSNQCVIWQVDGNNIIGLDVSNFGSTLWGGPTIKNINFTAKTGTEAGALRMQASNAVLENLNFDGFGNAVITTPAAPAIALLAGGSIATATTIDAKVAWENGSGETVASSASSTVVTTSGNQEFRLTQPASPPASALYWVVFVRMTGGVTSPNSTYNCISSDSGCRIPIATTTVTYSSAPTFVSSTPLVYDESGGYGLKLIGDLPTAVAFANQDTVTHINCHSNNTNCIQISRRVASPQFFAGDWMAKAGTGTVLQANESSGAGGAFHIYGAHCEGGDTCIKSNGFGASIYMLIEQMTTGINLSGASNFTINANMSALTTGITTTGGHNFFFMPDNSRNITNPIVDNSSGSNIIFLTGVASSTVTGSGASSDIFITDTGIVLPSIKAATGQRYVCVDTSGNLVSSASACSGT